MPFYRLLIACLFPLLALGALWRVLRGREDAAAFRDRLLGPRPAGPVVWIHGASNGELASARPLIAALRDADPDRRLLVTANTVTGRDMVAGWGLDRVTAGVAPFDTALAAARMFRGGRVTALIVLESELWPNRLASAHARAVPVLMIAARLSGRSAEGWQRRRTIARALLRPVALLSAQDPDSEARLRDLGVPLAATAPRVDLKSLYRPGPETPAPALSAAFPRAATVLAASTHPGEEEMILEGFVRARCARLDLRLILAPRHPRRGEEVLRIARALGLRVARRSLGEEPGAAEIYLADTMGEMDLWYRLAGAAFIGGSLVELGGHTPYEPAVHDCAILHGPHVGNFREVYARLDAGGGALEVRSAGGIANGWLAHLDASPMAERARTLLRPDDAGALLDRIEAILTE